MVVQSETQSEGQPRKRRSFEVECEPKRRRFDVECELPFDMQGIAEEGGPMDQLLSSLQEIEGEPLPSSPALSLEDLADMDCSWTIVNGRVYGIDDLIPSHPGGSLILRSVGEDATELFHAHHFSRVAYATLARYEIGHVSHMLSKVSPLRAELNKRVAMQLQVPKDPTAEGIAIAMLALFVLWAYLAYVKGWVVLNIVLSWFWSRHLDAGLHCAVHGDFSYSRLMHRRLLQIYSVLCHHMLDYYKGGNDGSGLSQHYQHHLFTNDIRRDPDWTSFAVGRNWVRRSESNPWHGYNDWQCFYWLAVRCVLEPVSELITMVSTCMNGAGQMLEAPADASRFGARVKDVASWWLEALLSPGYQGAAFLFQPWWQALLVVFLGKVFAKLVLLPFSEVQHFLMPETPGGGIGEEFVVTQLRTTANLKLHSPISRMLDFLMFHGDSLQVEHHLWPSMSFLQLRKASRLLRETCSELGLPYVEIGYWEAYAKVWLQVRQHAAQPE
ncbi:unnamed protein product [Polarella glacialis]|uniref:Cytochrome b5 heme-binding domain-containing protein n=1 Tax=Polarella glacialis TaxID=89957 RepID=A0A813I2J6_POLGL|nr:unnamed protein product [Polarella glacialis]